MMLADLGADVDQGRPAVGQRPRYPGGGRPAEPRPAQRRARPQDSRAGVETVRRLVEQADVFVEGFRPGVAERLGLGPDVLLARQPALVYGRMTGWGQDGPLAGPAGHDIDYLALTGALHAIGPAEKPAVPLNLIGDFGGGVDVPRRRDPRRPARGAGQRTGSGGRRGDRRRCGAPDHDGARLARRRRCGRTDAPRNLLDGGAPFYDVYETADGRHVAVGPLEPQFYREFAERLGSTSRCPTATTSVPGTSCATGSTNGFATRTQDEWAEVFADSDALRGAGALVARGRDASAPGGRDDRSRTVTASCNRRRRRASRGRREPHDATRPGRP